MQKSFNPVRGMYDYAPKEALVREQVREVILKNYQKNGYSLIDTPILENLAFLDSSEGGDNLKLMFKTVKRRDKLDLTKPDLTEKDIVEEGLRYDLTVPLSRFYAGNRETLPSPFKAIQIGNVFRAERPQRGRNRQFVQCDIDVFGDKTIFAELDLLLTTIETLKLLKFEHLTLKINNRQILNALVTNAGFEEKDIPTVCVTLDKVDKIQLAGVVMELLEKGFEAEKINRLVEILDDVLANGLNCLTRYGVDEEVVQNLGFLVLKLQQMCPAEDIKFDVTIVRGQGYYTGTVYEMYADGFAGAIVGGGRYDKMLNKIAGIDVPAVGCSIGFEPVCMLINEAGHNFTKSKNLALVWDLSDVFDDVYKAKEELKKEYNVSLYLAQKNMKNFYEKIKAVADFVTTVRDFKEKNPIKTLNQ